MNQYSIEVSGGKVIGDSVFFRTADAQLAEECNRICAFTGQGCIFSDKTRSQGPCEDTDAVGQFCQRRVQ
jgi:hypothetical protein